MLVQITDPRPNAVLCTCSGFALPITSPAGRNGAAAPGICFGDLWCTGAPGDAHAPINVVVQAAWVRFSRSVTFCPMLENGVREVSATSRAGHATAFIPGQDQC